MDRRKIGGDGARFGAPFRRSAEGSWYRLPSDFDDESDELVVADARRLAPEVKFLLVLIWAIAVAVAVGVSFLVTS